jgi:bacillithiol biosynthesis deacetylase BshB1
MIDVLAIGAHPDDCEIFMAGSIAWFCQGLHYQVVICDLTRGELGTYGSAEIRSKEAGQAAQLLGIKQRLNLEMADGQIENNSVNQHKLIKIIRQFKPKLIFSFNPHGETRHPDHRHCAELVQEAVFFSGVEKIMPQLPPHRPQTVISFPELLVVQKPDCIIDISAYWPLKQAAIRCYSTQVSVDKEDAANAKTFLRSARFWQVLEARSRTAGAMIGVEFGEPFFCRAPLNLSDPLAAFKHHFFY